VGPRLAVSRTLSLPTIVHIDRASQILVQRLPPDVPRTGTRRCYRCSCLLERCAQEGFSPFVGVSRPRTQRAEI